MAKVDDWVQDSDKSGRMVTGWHRWDSSRKLCDPDDGSGKWYFLDNLSRPNCTIFGEWDGGYFCCFLL